jgi:hypothetical protein
LTVYIYQAMVREGAQNTQLAVAAPVVVVFFMFDYGRELVEYNTIRGNKPAV